MARVFVEPKVRPQHSPVLLQCLFSAALDTREDPGKEGARPATLLCCVNEGDASLSVTGSPVGLTATCACVKQAKEQEVVCFQICAILKRQNSIQHAQRV